MTGRTIHRITTLVALSVVCATAGAAQSGADPVRKKPFEDFSASARRLKQSLTLRLGGEASSPVVDTIDLPSVSVALPQDSIVAVTLSQIGARYVLGAERPGRAFDCSGLVRFVMSALRIDVPRTAREQATQGTQVARDVGQLRPGDLLTFGRGSRVSHIGIYIGDGRFVHASTSRREVVEASIERPGTWFRRNWIGVRRLLASIEGSDSTRAQ